MQCEQRPIFLEDGRRNGAFDNLRRSFLENESNWEVRPSTAFYSFSTMAVEPWNPTLLSLIVRAYPVKTPPPTPPPLSQPELGPNLRAVAVAINREFYK